MDTKSLVLSRKEEGLLQANVSIFDSNPALSDLGFAPRCLVSASLPYRNPKPEQLENGCWVRRNGDYTLWIQGGANGLPYGSYPRVFMIWLTGEAVRSKSRYIDPGRSYREFCRALKIDPSLGKRGSARSMLEQIDRLLSSRAASIKTTTTDKKTHGIDTKFLPFADEIHLWWSTDYRNPEQGALFDSQIVLTQLFFDEITSHYVPLDMRAVAILRNSPLELDVYQWLAQRMFTLRQPSYLTWPQLLGQFGSSFGRTRDFKTAFLGALKTVYTVYPGLNVTPTDSGLALRPSPTPVPRAVQIVTSV